VLKVLNYSQKKYTMATESKQIWILAGYDLFAKEGPKGLKVEVIARLAGKSKSSFYHYFAELEIFTEALLGYHLERAIVISDKERLCKSVVPDLLKVLIEVKKDLLFNRQLRIHRNIPAFRLCFEKASKDIGDAIGKIWAEMLGLTDNSSLARIVLNLSIENFYLQITDETLTYEWFESYLDELKRMVKAFQNSTIK
jgi:AcrR family transcriptional regulator